MATNIIQSHISELEKLRKEGFSFRGHENFKYESRPPAFRLDTKRKMEKQFGIAEAEIARWFNSKIIIDMVDQWATGVRALPEARKTIYRLLKYCLYLMQYNYSLNIFAQNNIHRISRGDHDSILIRNAKYWKQETTFYDMFSRYLPTIIKRYDRKNNLVQDANPYEDLAGVDESLAQHYGIPTAALDVTKNPKVAIYFAIGDKKTEAKFLKIYAIKTHEGVNCPPIQIIEASNDVENIRAQRQEGAFVYFTKPCTFYLEHGALPSINYFDNRYNNNLDIRTFELRGFTIERTENNIEYLENILNESGIDTPYLFPDLYEEKLEKEAV